MINMHKVDLIVVGPINTFGETYKKYYFIQAGRKRFLKQLLLLIKTFGDTFLQTTLPIYKKWFL